MAPRAERAERRPVHLGNIPGAGVRDPYFPPWPDVVQLNAFNFGLRKAAIQTVSSIAGQCDGMRCDMAMLMMNAIFERTWEPGQVPDPQLSIGRT